MLACKRRSRSFFFPHGDSIRVMRMLEAGFSIEQGSARSTGLPLLLSLRLGTIAVAEKDTLFI